MEKILDQKKAIAEMCIEAKNNLERMIVNERVLQRMKLKKSNQGVMMEIGQTQAKIKNQKTYIEFLDRLDQEENHGLAPEPEPVEENVENEIEDLTEKEKIDTAAEEAAADMKTAPAEPEEKDAEQAKKNENE